MLEIRFSILLAGSFKRFT